MVLAERVRIEHTSTRKRADNGFEDREGHQAPITLRTPDRGKSKRPFTEGNEENEKEAKIC
jgi:hypothetical protein